MPTLRIELPAYVSKADVEALRGDLAPFGYVDELSSASYDPAAVMLGISFVSDVLQSSEHRGSGQLPAAHAPGLALLLRVVGGEGQNL